MTETLSKNVVSRIDSIDYLRGLAALSILAYHMYLFNFGEVDSSSILGKFKIYGVSIFYILSGITLYVVYKDRLHLKKKDLLEFYIKRFFRLVPLLWLVTLLTVLLQYNPEIMSLKKIILNITVLPGAIKPEGFIASGAWSIGNEIFFYLFFPFMIFLIRFKRPFIFLFLAAALGFLIYFTFYVLDPAVPLGFQWSAYVNPLGQFFYFITGIALGILGKYIPQRKLVYLLFFGLFFFLFAYYHVQGEPVMLVTGVARMVLSAYVVLLCLFFYKTDFSGFAPVLKTCMQFLGNISYSLYLLHPIVYFVVKTSLGMAGIESISVVISCTVVFSLFFAYLSYVFVEQTFIEIGKRFVKRIGYKV
ncbi:acyltransferase family protein [Pedobacter frigoris]|uniref:Acyltransferase n=1 Tax=Pedobacter frigoris TaxID=2571272 RepID=A0A4U1CR44_9SPHI|nr:acyltransferase [Pedobacter frigoris]TKC09325.1 acyltransferase [Pedobacter frigoris]